MSARVEDVFLSSGTSDKSGVCVVVLNCNGKDVLPECLRSLSRSDYPNVEVCVADNASTDGSPEWAEHEMPSVQVLRNGRNLGWSGGNNAGIRRALSRGAEYVWILNNDVEVEPDCISRMVRYAEAHPQTGVLGPLIYYFEPRDRVWFAGGRIDMESFETVHCERIEEFTALPNANRFISGCALLVRREVFDRIGLIDERFFIYCEDTDFCRRASQAGFGIDLVESAVMVHKVSAFSGGHAVRSPFKAYHGLRSSLLFWRKHLGWWTFHRQYCAAQLGKWVNGLVEEWACTDTNARAGAIIDALWYFVSCANRPLEWPRAPAGFRNLVLRRPWLFAELMAFRFGGLLRGWVGGRRRRSLS